MALSKHIISAIALVAVFSLALADEPKPGYLPPVQSSSHRDSSDDSNYASPSSHSPSHKPSQSSHSSHSDRSPHHGSHQQQQHQTSSSSFPESSFDTSYQQDVSGAVGTVPVTTGDVDAYTLKDIRNIDVDGSYNFEFETSNGIRALEQGHSKDIGNGETAEVADGGFSYTAPDGQVIALQYVADETGFHPVGDHLPTPPPIPEAIQRALDYIKARGVTENQQYNR